MLATYSVCEQPQAAGSAGNQQIKHGITHARALQSKTDMMAIEIVHQLLNEKLMVLNLQCQVVSGNEHAQNCFQIGADVRVRALKLMHFERCLLVRDCKQSRFQRTEHWNSRSRHPPTTRPSIRATVKTIAGSGRRLL